MPVLSMHTVVGFSQAETWRCGRAGEKMNKPLLFAAVIVSGLGMVVNGFARDWFMFTMSLLGGIIICTIAIVLPGGVKPHEQ
jgi:hypothetical protein